jgi:hypothetical protein
VGLRLDVTQRYLAVGGDVSGSLMPLLGMTIGLTSIPLPR